MSSLDQALYIAVISSANSSDDAACRPQDSDEDLVSVDLSTLLPLKQALHRFSHTRGRFFPPLSYSDDAKRVLDTRPTRRRLFYKTPATAAASSLVPARALSSDACEVKGTALRGAAGAARLPPPPPSPVAESRPTPTQPAARGRCCVARRRDESNYGTRFRRARIMAASAPSPSVERAPGAGCVSNAIGSPPGVGAVSGTVKTLHARG